MPDADDGTAPHPGSGEDEEGAFGGGDGFTLWGVETGEKIHVRFIFAGGSWAGWKAGAPFGVNVRLICICGGT